jgi:hypothetical protein
MFKIKYSINHTKNSVRKTANRLDLTGQILSVIEGKVEKLLHLGSNGEKNQT